MKLSVVGAGYVGLTTAACLAQVGHEVFCSDSDPNKLSKLQAGIVPFFEPFLENIVRGACGSGRLRFGSTNDCIEWAETIFICVGTPPLANGDADLSALEDVARTIAKRAFGHRLVVEKSTVPVQTGAQLQRNLSFRSACGLTHDVASNPEFLREGSSVEDFLHPDRIVVGVNSARSADLLRDIYGPVIKQNFVCPVHEVCPPKTPTFLTTDIESAELIKHASNSFLAMKISFINMIADLCERVGADVTEVAYGMGLDPRIGSSFLRPGIGFGGFCFPKDVQAFIRIAEKSGCEFSLLKEVERINQRRIGSFVDKIRQQLWVIRGKTIAMWGLAFKPNTDDVRFAPALALAKTLMDEGAVVRAYDPKATEKARAAMPNLTLCGDPYEAAKGADAILTVTEWDEFRRVDWVRLSEIMEQPLVIDGRNMFTPEDIARHGFRYVSIGRLDTFPSLGPKLPKDRYDVYANTESGADQCDPQ
jgi:UDPglucose 6-dehydrogenase